jgi:hypothetical protein
MASRLQMQESFVDPATELLKLQGIGRSQAEAFSEERINTILQLAYSDPVDLALRTGFSFSYVVDCCSQALLWLSFESDLPKMRRYALRGAQEVCAFVNQLCESTGQDPERMKMERALAEKTLPKLAAEVGLEVDVLRKTFDEITYDPYTQFLVNVWQDSWN